MHHELMTQEVPNENQVRQGLTNVHLGRGGAGNVRSPSRDPQEQYLHEQEKPVSYTHLTLPTNREV